MALILSIDTATEIAIISLGNENEIIAIEQNDLPMNHASFVQPAIERIFAKTNCTLSQIDAIAVSAGPGSYTGLRVGLSSAKGLCFALDKPLILLNTLQILAQEAILQVDNKDALYCPMIDARRMEVFTALFNYSLEEIVSAAPFILTEENFSTKIISHQDKEIFFFGSGMPKWKKITPETNRLFFYDLRISPSAINKLAQENFLIKSFADLAYSEPLYSKNFFTTAKISDNS